MMVLYCWCVIRNCPKAQARLHSLSHAHIHAGFYREVETNGDRLNELLQNSIHGKLDVCYLNRALKIAVKNDNHLNVGKLVVHGSTNISECLRYAKDARKPHARAMLLLIKAAWTGDIAIVRKVFGEHAPSLQNPQEYEDDGFLQVQEAVLSGSVSTVVPIEIAQRNQHHDVRQDLLLRTDLNKEEGYVYWHGLRLLQLDTLWLRKIAWVKWLRLARNGLRSLPQDIGTYLKQVYYRYTGNHFNASSYFCYFRCKRSSK